MLAKFLKGITVAAANAAPESEHCAFLGFACFCCSLCVALLAPIVHVMQG